MDQLRDGNYVDNPFGVRGFTLALNYESLVLVIVQTPHEKDKFFVTVRVVQKNISRKERREENAKNAE